MKPTARPCAPASRSYEALLSYKVGGVKVEPGLAENYEPNTDLTEWTFHLRTGVKFHQRHSPGCQRCRGYLHAQWDAIQPQP